MIEFGSSSRLRNLVDINCRALPESTAEDSEIEYLDISAVGTGCLASEPVAMRFGDAPSRARRLVRDGDTIVSTVRTYLRAVWPVNGSTSKLVVSTGFAVLTPRTAIDPRYLGWVCQSSSFIDEVVARSNGVSYPAINAPEIGEIRVPLPTQREQLAIAVYLDAETARIDALIAKKQRMMELIDEKLWALATDMIEERKRQKAPLRRFINRICDGPFGSSLTSHHYSEGGARVVRLGNIGFTDFKDDDQAFISTEYFSDLLRHRVLPGDLLIAGLGDSRNHVGRACVAPDLGDAIVKADCYCASVNSERAVPDYLAIFLSSPLGETEVAVASRGSTRSRINLEIALEIEIPMLSLAEQRDVVSSFASAREQSAAVGERLAKQVGLLQERRQALITAAVTGQLDIPEVVHGNH